MTASIEVDLCVIGAGSGGLSVASGAAQLGFNTILIERSAMGGDCLNTGCVPSKALLAAAKRAQMHRKDDIKGIAPHEPEIDFSAIKDHVFDTIKTIEPNDSPERFRSLGVNVILEEARFLAPDTVQAGDQIIKARHFVIATGSRAVLPPILGLDKDKVLTNETIFGLREKPEHLLVIGGGPIGIEMAQAHQRLHCKVSVFDRESILPKDDQSNVEVVRKCLIKEGVEIHEHVAVNEVKHTESGVSLVIEKNGKIEEFNGSHLLIAAGRAPNIDSLDLVKAGVMYDKKGITVDLHLKSSNKKIYAIGDVSGGPQFTHVAGYHAGIIIRQICFKMFWAKVDYKALPWVTYTDPELAQVGVTEELARKQYGDKIKVVEWHFDENDRAIAERTTNGTIRVITNKKGLILGASIVGPQAGELIGLWTLAISSGLKIGAVTGMIAPYPTLGEVSKRAAGAWYTASLFSDKTRQIVGWLQKLPI
ncbi:MAG: pyruvate/2-oxoglutarate dehydrogenase complex dihydrolipoamide dehydrogenase (E3) component [Oleiphilaceae bacterium]|jgi:pyruvate/2-oxoglutarate dehydrogenase complex dihydrolipoamide dehydrogenase (E3) component